MIPRAAGFAGLLILAPLGALRGQVDYQRAEQLLTWNALRLVTNDYVAPTWYRDSTRFWYRVITPLGPAFFTVTPATGAKAPLFDNARLAAALTVVGDTAVDPVKLPFQSFGFEEEGRNERAIRVKVGTRGFSCEVVAYRCAAADTLADRTRYVRSPDHRWDAFIHQHNLWVRPVAGGDSIQLTTDGEALYSYGEPALRATQVRQKQPVRPQLGLVAGCAADRGGAVRRATGGHVPSHLVHHPAARALRLPVRAAGGLDRADAGRASG